MTPPRSTSTARRCVMSTVAGVGVLALVSGGAASSRVTDAAPASAPDTMEAAHIARGHGVQHDRRAVASIARWVSLGQPSGVGSPPPLPQAVSQDVLQAVSQAGAQAVSQDMPQDGAGAAAVDKVVTLHTTGSNLAFEPSRLSLKAGTTVRLEYTNDGVLPHNFALLESEDDLDALGAAAYDAEATGYIPVEERDKLIAYTALASPGTTVTVTFVVPAPGTYTFVCLFPGHYNVMLGTLRALA